MFTSAKALGPDTQAAAGNTDAGKENEKTALALPTSVATSNAFSSLSFDRPLHAAMAHLTGGVSPAALSQAYTDWLQHIWSSPDKQIALLEKAAAQWARYLQYCPRAFADASCDRCIEPLPQDNRFRAEAWQRWPFNAIYQGFLLTQQWWHTASTGVDGVSKHHEGVAGELSPH